MPEIVVHGEPVAKERPRRGKGGSWYTPTRTRDYEALVAWTWKQTGIKPMRGPVSVRLDFWLGGRDKDLDNLVKATLDGLNGVAFVDDRQIVCLTATKGHQTGQEGRADIRVLALV